MKSCAPNTELSPSTQLRKVIFGSFHNTLRKGPIMKKTTPAIKSTEASIMRLLSAFLLAVFTAASLAADVVYVTSRPQPRGNGPNGDGTYFDYDLGNDTTAKSTAPGVPPRSGSRYFSNSFSNSTPDYGITITPTLGLAGGVYQVDHTYSSGAGNVSSNIVLSVTNVAGCTLSFMNNIDKFQSPYGEAPTWQFLGYLTNDPGSATPAFTFYYQSGQVSAADDQRLEIDCFRFTYLEPCLAVPVPTVIGPLSTNSSQVVVAGVTNTATKVTVYQATGTNMVAIGSKTSGITNGVNQVTVSGLVKTAKVAATQTVAGQEGCVPTTGVVVGGGNARVRVAFSIKETSSTGPVGEPGEMSNANMHFLGATNVLSGYAPEGGPVLTPSTSWQTVTLKRGFESVGDSANAAGTCGSSKGYGGNDTVRIQVYAYRTLHGVSIYSTNAAESSIVTSNHAFAVNWTWNEVAGAQGYRLLRDVNSAGYYESVNVTNNSYTDANTTAWTADTTVTPNTTQTDSSIQWYPDSNLYPDALPGDWGILEAIAFAIDDLTDTGPYDLYIDNLKNGTTVFQTFEGAVADTTDYCFRPPDFSGTTSGGLLMPPDIGQVSNGAADTGTKSFHVQFQWNGTNAESWLRLATYSPAGSPIPGGNPMVNLSDPISIRVLLLPVGTIPAPPSRPTLSVKQFGPDVVLNWANAHNLQTSVKVTGTYTNVPGVILGPYTNNFPEPQRFFRLAN
jgi:hypothetical protein